ncbi:MAG: RIP metalloprotease RseP [Candidatus Omnitrophica bacterium]|nr:RIP metalloprotease RseP [Candidatus Omnitrophota bacterium]
MISFLIFIFVLSILIIVHEFGHFIAAKKTGVRVEKFSIGFGKELLKKKGKDTEYSISAIPLGGYVKLAGDNLSEYKGAVDEYFSKSLGRRFWIIFFGPLLNYVLGFLFLWLILFIGYPTFTTKIGGLIDGFGAKEAGLKVKDRITAVDGKSVEYWDDLQKIIQEKGRSAVVRLNILREGKNFEVDVVIKGMNIENELGERRSIGLLGVTPYDEVIIVKRSFFSSIALALKKVWFYTSVTYRGLWRMVLGKLSIRDSVTGPLGIYLITYQAARLGIVALLHLIAVLSISLAIFNLLPFPLLDGGHILLLGLEKIRGKALGERVERIINQIGFSMIISLALFVTYNDIMRLFGDKIDKFFGK